MKRVYGVVGLLFITILFATCGSAPTSTRASAPELTEVSSYYVRANGNDRNAGTSENAPFKTLVKALEVADTTTIKKITVIGTFIINKETRVHINTGSEEILISGKQNAAENEKAILKGTDTLLVLHGNSNIRFEYITLQGENGQNNEGSRGIWVEQDATLTLGRDVVITQFDTADIGAGVFLGGTLFMIENSLITNNIGLVGGGLGILEGNVIMRDEAKITNNISRDQEDGMGGGGVAVVENGTLTMQGNSSIAGNNAVSGGGVLIYNGTLVMEDNASIVNNISTKDKEGWGGGGVAIVSYGTLTMQSSSSITGNKAVSGGGVHVNRGTLTMEDNATIKNNESTGGMLNGGGGICLFWQGEAILKDNSLVTENIAKYGGGVFTKSEDLEFEGGSIGVPEEYTFQTGNIRGNFAERGTDIYRNMR